jgi:hypothetical protein
MSWLFSQALVAEYSAASCSDGAPSAPSNTTATPQAFLWRDKTTDAWNRFPSGMTCEPLTGSRGEELLTWFREGFLVKTCPEQRHTTAAASLWPMGWMASDPDSGGKWPELFVTLDRDTSWWKTSQLCLMKELESFSETWPRWGLMRDGACYRLPQQVPRITAREYFWLLTPSASDGKKRFSFRSASLADRYRKHPKGNLAEQVSFLAQDRGVMDGRLNPVFWDWMTGWPTGWTDLQPVAMRKFQQWLRSHGVSSADPDSTQPHTPE